VLATKNLPEIYATLSRANLSRDFFLERFGARNVKVWLTLSLTSYRLALELGAEQDDLYK
jgi:hypothetical protein